MWSWLGCVARVEPTLPEPFDPACVLELTDGACDTLTAAAFEPAPAGGYYVSVGVWARTPEAEVELTLRVLDRAGEPVAERSGYNVAMTGWSDALPIGCAVADLRVEGTEPERTDRVCSAPGQPFTVEGTVRSLVSDATASASVEVVGAFTDPWGQCE
ncbi:MAG: hypothetical protein ABMA64_15735 [Myxococcota bacterium]